jgi:hypothetical protein
MYQIAAPILNRIAQQGELQTALAKRLFALNQEKLGEALEAQETKLQKEGTPRKVAVALLTVGPFLWENQAVAKFVLANPSYLDVLPDLADEQEAVIMATKEYSLNTPQQKLLTELLQNPARLAQTVIEKEPMAMNRAQTLARSMRRLKALQSAAKDKNFSPAAQKAIAKMLAHQSQVVDYSVILARIGDPAPKSSPKKPAKR